MKSWSFCLLWQAYVPFYDNYCTHIRYRMCQKLSTTLHKYFDAYRNQTTGIYPSRNKPLCQLLWALGTTCHSPYFAGENIFDRIICRLAVAWRNPTIHSLTVESLSLLSMHIKFRRPPKTDWQTDSGAGRHCRISRLSPSFLLSPPIHSSLPCHLICELDQPGQNSRWLSVSPTMR